VHADWQLESCHPRSTGEPGHKVSNHVPSDFSKLIQVLGGTISWKSSRAQEKMNWRSTRLTECKVLECILKKKDIYCSECMEMDGLL